MAKELPYFKFFVSEWSDGDITLEDYRDQGVFINVCAYYWSNECELEYEKLLKKFKHATESIDILENAGILKVENGTVWINFLDEQWNERKTKSLINSANGAKGGRPKKPKETEKKPNALNSLSETKGNKKREEKKREEKSIEVYRKFKHLSLSQKEFDKLKEDYTQSQIDEILDSIENYALNKNYTSLNLTARKWLKKQYPKPQDTPQRINPSAFNPVN